MKKTRADVTNTFIFNRFFIENRPKNDQKSEKEQRPRRNREKTAPATTFTAKKTHFSHFWAPLGSQNGLQNGPLDEKLGFNWPGGGPGGLREPICIDFGGFCLHFGGILESPGSIFCEKSCKGAGIFFSFFFSKKISFQAQCVAF